MSKKKSFEVYYLLVSEGTAEYRLFGYLTTKKFREMFNNLGKFRDYCKPEFKKHFGKKVSDFKDADFDSIFNNVDGDEIKSAFVELFATLS